MLANGLLSLVDVGLLSAGLFEKASQLLVDGSRGNGFLGSGLFPAFLERPIEAFLLSGQLVSGLLEPLSLLRQLVFLLLALRLPLAHALPELVRPGVKLLEDLGEEVIEFAVAGADFLQGAAHRIPRHDLF